MNLYVAAASTAFAVGVAVGVLIHRSARGLLDASVTAALTGPHSYFADFEHLLASVVAKKATVSAVYSAERGLYVTVETDGITVNFSPSFDARAGSDSVYFVPRNDGTWQISSIMSTIGHPASDRLDDAHLFIGPGFPIKQIIDTLDAVLA